MPKLGEKDVHEMLQKKRKAIGAKMTLKNAKKGKVKTAVIASNCPISTKKKLKSLKVDVLKFRGSSKELGIICGKPFTVSVVGLE